MVHIGIPGAGARQGGICEVETLYFYVNLLPEVVSAEMGSG